jgi:hypothetical protein
MTQRRSQARMIIEPDPLAEVSRASMEGVADELSKLLDGLSAFDQSSIRVYLHRMPMNGFGRFEMLEELAWPFDPQAIMTSVKERHGGGRYRIQTMAGGATRKNTEFAIAGDPIKIGATAATATTSANGFNMSEMLMFIQTQQAEARREQAEFARLERERQDRAAERHNALLVAGIGALPLIIPLLNNREKLADIIGLMNANKPPTSNLKETVETITLMKGLFDGDKGGFDPSDVVGSIARLAGPVAAAAGQAFRGRGAVDDRQQGAPAEEGQLYLPESPPLAVAAPITAPPVARPTNSVLVLIQPHVLYFFHAGHDPALAAEAVADIMLRQEVKDEDVNGLVSAFFASPDWKADLAGQGIDLTSNPGWADTFLRELVSAWTESGADGEPGAGGDGGLADLADDAGLQPAGVLLHGDPGPGASAHQ